MQAWLLRSAIKILVLTTLVITSPALLSGEAGPPDTETLRMLKDGQVINETIRADESGGAARFQIYMEAPVGDIWDVIYSCEHAFVYLNGLRLCELLENDGNTTLTRQVVKTSWLVPAQDFTFQTERQPYTRADFKRTAGSPKVMEGSWQFLELAQGMMVTHEIRIKPFFPVPKFLIRRLMRNSMPEMLACMRALAGGSLSEDQQKADYRLCPGDEE